MIKENVKSLFEELPKGVKLVGAAKTRTPEEVLEAVESGLEIIGENYVLEAEEKFKELKEKVKFHCIGHIQTNKAKKAVEIFDMIETVDSLKLAKEINKRCKDIGKVMPVLIEVNIGKEENKAGCMPEDDEKLIKNISTFSDIKVKGLMTMAPYFDDAEKDRPYFKKTKELYDKIKSLGISNVDMEILSMGMSDSYKIAIEEGATMVRVGSKIFGLR